MSPANPNFSRAQSDVNAYLSGDDKDAWDDEGERMVAKAAKQEREENVDDCHRPQRVGNDYGAIHEVSS